jgi:hypothetical protein
MKTNITTDNYEAYLLDYMDGNLSPDEAEQLKAFVAAQGMDWDELTEELPHLEAPQIAFEGKESLKQRALSLSKGRPSEKKRTIIPLYVKIASVAAAAGLLLTVTLWPKKSMQKTETIAELKPILPGRLITASETTTLPPRTFRFAQPQVVKKERPTFSETVSERVEAPLVAQLEPQKAPTLPTSSTVAEPDFNLLAYRMNTDLALAFINEYGFKDFSENEEFDREPSLIGKGLLWLTKGRHDSFASIIASGLTTAKKELDLAATDFALTAYNRADESFEEAKEYWEEKIEK